MPGPRDNELVFTLDGPGVGPKTVEPVEALRLAADFFDLIKKFGVGSKALELKGIRTFKGSQRFAVITDDTGEASVRAHRVRRCMEGVEFPPPQVVVPFEVFRRKLVHISESRKTAAFEVGVGGDVGVLVPLPSPVAEVHEEMEARAVIISVTGGDGRFARVAIAGEPRAFRVELPNQVDVRRFGAHIDGAVDLVLRATRDVNGNIEGAKLLEATFVKHVPNELEMLRQWFKPAADEWAKVEDVDEELKRERIGSSH